VTTPSGRRLPGPPEGGGRILDLRLSGPPQLVDDALAALRLVLDVADASPPYPNRRGGGQRVYVRALGLSPEARRFLGR
jgi:hypothetical protein